MKSRYTGVCLCTCFIQECGGGYSRQVWRDETSRFGIWAISMKKETLVQFIWIILALGLPTSTTALALKVTDNLQSAIIVCFLTVVIEIIVGFATKVWQKLEPRWVDRVADSLDTAAISLFSGYRRKYLEYITYQHRAFDVKGLTTQGVYTLELNQVFVQLGIDAAPIHSVSANPLNTIPEELRSGSRSIWLFLKSQHFISQNFAIIGPPGSGKTTLLRHMALVLAFPTRLRRKLGAPDKLPVLLFLRDHASAITNNSDIGLAQLIRDQLSKWNAPPPPTGWLEARLNQGNCLVMLDGLDEVAEPGTRQQVVNWVEKCMIGYGRNRFVISSRPHGYRSNPLSGVAVLQVLPFTQQQIALFVQNWYLANEIMSNQRDDPGVRTMAHQGAEDLLTRLRETPALSAFATNPLLLTMIANIHRYRSSLPGRRVELYAEIFEVFLGKRQQARGLALDLTPAQKQRVLQTLAHAMMCHQQREISEKEALDIIAKPLKSVSPHTRGGDFLKMVENTSGLLVERENGIYSFAHLTFQEYLTAMHILENRLENELIAQVNNGWWQETIRLYCARTDASAIISACLAEEHSSVSALILAMACMEEAREVQPEVRAKYQAVISQGAEDLNPERRQLIANALISKRLGQR